MMKPCIIHGMAEDPASVKSWLLEIEHEMTCTKGGSGGVSFEFRAVLCASVCSA